MRSPSTRARGCSTRVPVAVTTHRTADPDDRRHPLPVGSGRAGLPDLLAAADQGAAAVQVLTDPGLDDAGAGGAGAASASALPLQAAEGVTRVLLVDNSHMQHWSTAIREIGRQEGWQVLLIYEQNCYLAPAGDPINEVEKCADFWPDVLDSIEPLDPDLVITVATKSEDDGETTLTSGLELLEEHVKPERTVIAMRDTPRFEVGLTQCEANRQPDEPPCESGHPILDTPNPLIPLVKSVKGLNTMELSDLVCPERLCVSTIGNVRVWMDQHHLTRDYVETTTDLWFGRG